MLLKLLLIYPCNNYWKNKTINLRGVQNSHFYLLIRKNYESLQWDNELIYKPDVKKNTVQL